MVKNVWIVRDYIEEGGVRRAMVVVDLQTEEKNKNKNVSVWLVTLKLEGMTEWSHYSPTYNI